MSTVRPNREGARASVELSRAQPPVRDHQADAERIGDEFHALPVEVRDETFQNLASEYGLIWEPDRIRWSSLFGSVLIVALVGLVLARDPAFYKAYDRGAITMAGVIGSGYYLLCFAQSVWLKVRDRRAARRGVA